MFIFLTGDVDKNDHKEIINNIIASSYLPLSIIIICVGNHDFSKISGLFLDNKYSSEGIPKNKENVIFATIKNKYDSELIVETCLMKLRKQIIEFFQLVKSPENLKESINKISQSIVIVKNCINEEKEEKKEEINIINNPTPGGIHIIKNEDDKNDDKNNKKEDEENKKDEEEESNSSDKNKLLFYLNLIQFFNRDELEEEYNEDNDNNINNENDELAFIDKIFKHNFVGF